jgi:hypothetical protein
VRNRAPHAGRQEHKENIVMNAVSAEQSAKTAIPGGLEHRSGKDFIVTDGIH